MRGSDVSYETFLALLRKDLYSFTHKAFTTILPGDRFLSNWHIEALAHRLQEVAEGRIKRLVITLPPRSLKSICASVALPAWYLGRDPTRRVICASYSESLAVKLANQRRSVMRAPWYQDAFPARISGRKDTETEFETTLGGSCFTTSVGGTITGRGGNLIIIDDPAKPGEAMSEVVAQGIRDWFDGTLYSRLDNMAEDAIVIVMQRLHVDDLAGHVLQHGDWVHLDLPAIAIADAEIPIGNGRVYRRRVGDLLHPERMSRAELDGLKARMGTYFFEAQYQQQPVPPGGNMIKWHWFQRFERMPEREPDDQIVQSWDTASTANELSDYSACITALIRNGAYYVIDVFRDRLDYPNLKRKVVDLYRQYRPDAVLIEDKGSGIQLVQDLNYDGLVFATGINPQGDKVVRASNQSGQIEGGRVYLPTAAPWLGDFRQEVSAFPNGRYDDQVDALTQFLFWMREDELNAPRIREL